MDGSRSNGSWLHSSRFEFGFEDSSRWGESRSDFKFAFNNELRLDSYNFKFSFKDKSRSDSSDFEFSLKDYLPCFKFEPCHLDLIAPRYWLLKCVESLTVVNRNLYFHPVFPTRKDNYMLFFLSFLYMIMINGTLIYLQTEVNYLGQLHHPNLVKLIGYCLEGDNRLLVYEFMPKGSLENHLFRSKLQ